MAAIRKDHKFRAVDAVSHLYRQRIRNGVVLVTGQHQRWTLDPRKCRPRVRPAQDRRLLADEGLGAHIVAHVVHQLAQGSVLTPRRMHEPDKQLVKHRVIIARLRTRDLTAAAGGRFRRIGPRLGVDQRQFCNPLRRLPHDFERDIAAHGMPRQREARRRFGQDPARNRAHTVVADVVGNRHRAESPQRRNHGCE